MGFLKRYRLWPHDFLSQVAVLMLLLTSAAFALYALNTSRQQSRFIEQSITNIGLALSQNLSLDSANLLMRKDFASLEVLLRQYARLPNIRALAVIDAEGKPLSRLKVQNGQAVADYDYRRIETPDLTQATRLIDDQRTLLVREPITVARNTVGIVELRLSLEQASQERQRLLVSTLGFGLLTALALLTLMYLYFRKPLRAIREAGEFAATLDTRRGEHLMVTHSAREFEQLGESLNHVSQRLLEQERQVEASSAEARKLAMVASKTNNAVVITDADGAIEWVNAGFERMTGYRLDEVIGQRPASFLQGPDTDQDVRKRMRQHLDRQASFEVELINYSKSGQPYWVNIAVQPVFDENETLRNFIAIESDVTQRKANERQLHEAKIEAETANHAKSVFLSRMSHELRTPLNAILGFAQLLELDDLGEVNQDSVERIIKAGNHLLVLIDDVLDISKIESGGMSLSSEPVAIREATDSVIRLLQPQALSHDVSITIDDTVSEDLRVMGDLQRINQVLVNLLSNAIKYNNRNGSVLIRAERRPEDRLRLYVEDTGTGIPEDKIDRLFTPFDRLGAEQTGIEGSGIGLALIEHLLKAMNGSIGVSSIVGQGSTFWVELPSASDQQDSLHEQVLPARQTNAGTDASSRATVVYIEDNRSNVALVEKVMQRLGGIELHIAMQGQEGVLLIESVQPDLVLLDLHLPEMGGEEILEYVKSSARLRDIPVIIISADATAGQIDRLLGKGADGYITKPLVVQELMDHVRRFTTA